MERETQREMCLRLWAMATLLRSHPTTAQLNAMGEACDDLAIALGREVDLHYHDVSDLTDECSFEPTFKFSRQA